MNWTFFCNPKVWEIDRFLDSGIKEYSYKIRPQKAEKFEVGQLGVIRVSQDHRTRAVLGDHPKLQSGIYAVVEVVSQPALQPSVNNQFYAPNTPAPESPTLSVNFRLVHNLKDHPILLEDIKGDERIEADPYLIPGFQGSCMPLSPVAMQRILEIIEKRGTKPVPLHQEQGAARVWEVLTEAAKREHKPTNQEVGDAIGSHHRHVHQYLHLLQEFCIQEQLPPLTILVVDQRTGQPYYDYASYAVNIKDFDQACRQIYTFDWSSLKNPYGYALDGQKAEDLIRGITEGKASAGDILRLVRQRGSGQAFFREMILSLYGRKCAICSLDYAPILEACHLVPWHEASDEQRLSPDNGILLCANHHKMLDRGLFSFTPDYRIIVNQDLMPSHFILELEGRKITLPNDERWWPKIPSKRDKAL